MRFVATRPNPNEADKAMLNVLTHMALTCDSVEIAEETLKRSAELHIFVTTPRIIESGGRHWLMWGEKQMGYLTSDTCPKCGHAAHGPVCLNIASDNDCNCKFDEREL